MLLFKRVLADASLCVACVLQEAPDCELSVADTERERERESARERELCVASTHGKHT